MLVANFNIARSALKRSRSQLAHTGAPGLSGGQGSGHDFMAVGESDLAGGDLAHLASQTIIDLVADDQKAEQRTFGSRAKINRLHEGLVEMVVAEPPVARVLLV